jgi:hypothetical protein
LGGPVIGRTRQIQCAVNSRKAGLCRREQGE